MGACRDCGMLFWATVATIGRLYFRFRRRVCVLTYIPCFIAFGTSIKACSTAAYSFPSTSQCLIHILYPQSQLSAQPTTYTMVSLRSFITASIAVSAVLAIPTHTNIQRDVAADLNHQLVGEPTALGRFKLLNSSVNNFIFDFVAARDAAVPGPDGTVVLATAGNYPAAVGNGVAMGVGESSIARARLCFWNSTD